MARYRSGPRLLPVCIEDKTSSDVGQETDYPIGFTYEQWFENYFRVKDWTLQIDYSMSGSCTAASASASASLDGPSTGDSTSELDTESDFSCTYNDSYMSAANDSAFDDDTTVDGYASVGLGTLFSSPTVGFNVNSCYKVGDIYYPKMSFSFFLAGTAQGASGEGTPLVDSTLYWMANWNSPDPNYTPYFIPLEVNGVNATKQGTLFYADSSEGEGSADVQLNMTLIKLTPKSYWGYDGVWNTSTGAQILNPFNP